MCLCPCMRMIIIHVSLSMYAYYYNTCVFVYAYDYKTICLRLCMCVIIIRVSLSMYAYDYNTCEREVGVGSPASQGATWSSTCLSITSDSVSKWSSSWSATSANITKPICSVVTGKLLVLVEEEIAALFVQNAPLSDAMGWCCTPPSLWRTWWVQPVPICNISQHSPSSNSGGVAIDCRVT